MTRRKGDLSRDHGCAFFVPLYAEHHIFLTFISSPNLPGSNGA